MGAQPISFAFPTYPGAKVNFFEKDTTTKQDAFTDSGLSTPTSNPATANSEGGFSAYLDDTDDYTVKVTSSDASITIFELDYIAGSGSFVIKHDGTVADVAAADTVLGFDNDGTLVARTQAQMLDFLGLDSDDDPTFDNLTVDELVAAGLSYPTTDGSDGQVIGTDGAGNLAFITTAGSGDLLASANLSDLDDAATALSNIGGQAQDDLLDDIAALTDPGADRILFWDDSEGAIDWLSLGTGLAFDGTTLDLDADLATLAGLTVAANNFIVGNSGGTAWEVKTPSQARTALSLGTIATQDADSVNIDGGAIDGTTIGANTAAAGNFTTLSATGDVTCSSGNLFLGTTSGSNRLTVNGAASFSGTIFGNRYRVDGVSRAYYFDTDNSSDFVTIGARISSDTADRNMLTVNPNGVKIGVGVTDGASSGTPLEVVGNGSVSGSFSKGSGSFKIDHPLPELAATHWLIHSFVESPTADNVYRGEITLEAGTASVDIDAESGMTPGTFAALNGNAQVFLQNETGWEPVKGEVKGATLTITCRNEASTDTVSWLVIAERQDQHMLDTQWTDAFGRPILEPLKPEDETETADAAE